MILAHSSRMWFLKAGMPRWQELEGTDDIAPAVRKQGVVNPWAQPTFFLLPKPENGAAHFMMGFLILINLIKIFFLRG